MRQSQRKPALLVRRNVRRIGEAASSRRSECTLEHLKTRYLSVVAFARQIEDTLNCNHFILITKIMYGNSKGQFATYTDGDDYYQRYSGQEPRSNQSPAYRHSTSDPNRPQYGPGATSMSHQSQYPRTSSGYAEDQMYHTQGMARGPSSQSTSTNGSSPGSPGSYKAKEYVPSNLARALSSRY